MLNVTPDGYGAIGWADRNPTATFMVTLWCSPWRLLSCCDRDLPAP